MIYGSSRGGDFRFDWHSSAQACEGAPPPALSFFPGRVWPGRWRRVRRSLRRRRRYGSRRRISAVRVWEIAVRAASKHRSWAGHRAPAPRCLSRRRKLPDLGGWIVADVHRFCRLGSVRRPTRLRTAGDGGVRVRVRDAHAAGAGHPGLGCAGGLSPASQPLPSLCMPQPLQDSSLER